MSDTQPITVTDVLAQIRFDRETKLGSVLDVIQMVTGCEPKHTTQALNRILESYPDLTIRRSGSFHTFKFSGRGQRDTPVASIPDLVNLILQLPGKNAGKWRSHAAEVLCRAFGGDPQLVKEIEARQNAPKDSITASLADGAWTPLDQMDFSPEYPDDGPNEGVVYIAGSPDITFIKVGMWTGRFPALFSRYKMVYGRSTWVRTWKSSDVREDEKRVLFALSVFSRGGELIDVTAYDFAVKLLNHHFDETIEEECMWAFSKN